MTEEKKVDLMLAIPCVERCGKNIVSRLPLEADELEKILAAKDWILSGITPPGQPIVTAVLCPDCAKKVHAPEVLAEMRRRRKAGGPS